MKKLINTMLMVCLIGTMAVAQSETGIKFESSEWAAVLAKAKAEKKYVFLDAYAVWCGPCKWMDRTVFPTEEAGNFFNSHFINVKMDMQKGEGVELAKKYEVHAFPTYLFVDSEGEIVHRMVGSRPLEEFISDSKKALDPKTQYGTLLKKFKTGEKNPDKLYAMAHAFKEAGDAEHTAEATEVYLATQKDWLTEKNIKFIDNFTTSAQDPQYKFMREHAEAFQKIDGEEKYNDKMYELAFREAVKNAGYLRNIKPAQCDSLIQNATAYFKETLPAQAPQLTSAFAMRAYMSAGDKDAYARQTMEHYQKYPSDNWNLLNSVAWNFFETFDNPEYLKAALGWAQKSVELNTNYANLDTLASLYYKLEDKDNAQKYAEQAIALGKQKGEDTASTEKLLQKISLL